MTFWNLLCSPYRTRTLSASRSDVHDPCLSRVCNGINVCIYCWNDPYFSSKIQPIESLCINQLTNQLYTLSCCACPFQHKSGDVLQSQDRAILFLCPLSLILTPRIDLLYSLYIWACSTRSPEWHSFIIHDTLGRLKLCEPVRWFWNPLEHFEISNIFILHVFLDEFGLLEFRPKVCVCVARVWEFLIRVDRSLPVVV